MENKILSYLAELEIDASFSEFYKCLSFTNKLSFIQASLYVSNYVASIVLRSLKHVGPFI